MLYLMPYHIKPLWNKIRDILNNIASTKNTSFQIQDNIETLFKLHFNSVVCSILLAEGSHIDKKIVFSNLKTAIDQMEDKAEVL